MVNDACHQFQNVSHKHVLLSRNNDFVAAGFVIGLHTTCTRVFVNVAYYTGLRIFDVRACNELGLDTDLCCRAGCTNRAPKTRQIGTHDRFELIFGKFALS